MGWVRWRREGDCHREVMAPHSIKHELQIRHLTKIEVHNNNVPN